MNEWVHMGAGGGGGGGVYGCGFSGCELNGQPLNVYRVLYDKAVRREREEASDAAGRGRVHSPHSHEPPPTLDKVSVSKGRLLSHRSRLTV